MPAGSKLAQEFARGTGWHTSPRLMCWAGRRSPSQLRRACCRLLLSLLSSSGVFVVGTTTRLQAIPPEVRRPGRLHTIVEVHLADTGARAKALGIILENFETIAPGDIQAIARRSHGFTAADLQSLCLRTFMECKGSATPSDFLRHAEDVRPSNLNSFQGFGRLLSTRCCIADKYRTMQVDPPRGILIHGPPGTGKSMMCCALAGELAVNTIWVDASQMRSMDRWRLFAQARQSAPCILLFDHIDALAPRRGTSKTSENTSDRIVTSLLIEMDGFGAAGSDVFVVAVTSRPHVVDPALLRPGRLDVHIGLDVPDNKATSGRRILDGYLNKMPAAASHVRHSGGADLANLCREAALSALRRDIESAKVTKADLLQCLN
ncbi:AAA-domain-containing protein [Linderina pennispora]|uniref:AAA-domain-containing protein n=1 Tax=Linderina pennispora TaxID=61395 RepID=A0A1Y1VZB8_9FUNG|nr:AAA-domain-containing protein [Linderina pennispora]ORX66365.1 AAA-domain-containing protein [Linderina pennispora]